MPRKKRPPLRGQRAIDFGRGAQLKALDDLTLPRRLLGLGEQVSRSTTMAVLRVLDGCQREASYSWPSLKTIAQRSRRCVRTVRRAINALESLGILTVWEERDSKGYRRLKYEIHWERIFGERLPPAPRERVPRPRKRQKQPVDSLAGPVDSLSQPSGQFVPPTTYEPKRETLTQPYPPTPHGGDEGWEGVEEVLFERGVKAFEQAVEHARKSVTAAHVLQLVEHYDLHRASHGWEPWNLYRRIRKARGFIPIDVEWPAPQGLAEAAQVDVEATFGSQLDRLGSDELQQLIQRGGPTLQSMVDTAGLANARRFQSLRMQLLTLMQRLHLQEAIQ